jgi:hypothetical protein
MIRLANLSALFLATALTAQQEVPVPGVLDTLVTPTATSLQVQFQAPKNGLLVIGASLSPKTHQIRADLPPILAQFEVLEFRLASGATKFELPRWIATYWAQCGVLDLDSGAMKASYVMTVEPQAPAAERAAPAPIQADYDDQGDAKDDFGNADTAK